MATLTTLLIDKMPDYSRSHTKNFWMRRFDQVSMCQAIEDIGQKLDAIKNLPHPISVNHRHSLKKLYISSQFGDIQPAQYLLIAQFLDLLLPNLTVLETYGMGTEQIVWALVSTSYRGISKEEEVDIESN